MDLPAALKAFLALHVGENYADSKYLLAVSGGLDSMVLLQLFQKVLPPSALAVAHYNHATRGLDSDGDEAFVRRSVGEAPFVYARREGGKGSSEADLRRDRHAFLEQARISTGCDFLVTAHHLDDQFETFLMRLGRGTGLKGLGSMPCVQGAKLRPLLSISRTQLEAYAAGNTIEHREDATNASFTYLRNRIRHSLVPTFHSVFEDCGSDASRLARFGDLVTELQEAEQLLDEQARSFAAHMVTPTVLWTRLDARLFDRVPRPWQRRLLRRVLEQLGVETLSRQDLENTLTQGAKRAWDGPGFSVQNSCGYTYFQTPAQKQRLQALRVHEEGGYALVSDLGIALAGIEPDTQVRFFQPGDRRAGQKLKTFFLENRIPKPERRIVPLLARKGTSEVVWVFPEPHLTLRIQAVDFAFAASVKSLGNVNSP